MVLSGRLSSLYFGALPAQPLRRILVDPTEVLEERGNPFFHAHKDDSLSPPSYPPRSGHHAFCPAPFRYHECSDHLFNSGGAAHNRGADGATVAGQCSCTSLISRALPDLWPGGTVTSFSHTIDRCRTILYYTVVSQDLAPRRRYCRLFTLPFGPGCLTGSQILTSAPSRSSHAFSIVMEKWKAMAEELLGRDESNGYKRGAHREKDTTRDDKMHINKTKKDQNAALDRYVL